MNNKFNEEKFNFSDEVKKQIKKSYKKFIKESIEIGKEYKISEDKKQIIISQFIENMIKKVLLKNEIEQKMNFTEDDKKYFKEKILKIIEKS